MSSLQLLFSSIGGFLLTVFYVTIFLGFFLIMGNICGKESGDPFAQPGRTLGSAPPAQTSSAVPAAARRTEGGRTLGGAGAASSQADARSQAALAAEVS